MAVALAVAVAVVVGAPRSSSGHFDFIVASPGITDFDGAKNKARRIGYRHWYVIALSNPEPHFASLQEECDQIALYVRDKIFTDLCIDTPSVTLICAAPKVGANAPSETKITFAAARQRLLGSRLPRVRVTGPGTHPTIPSTSTRSFGSPVRPEPDPEPAKARALLQNLRGDSSNTVVQKAKAFPVVPAVPVFRGAGCNPMVMPPMPTRYTPAYSKHAPQPHGLQWKPKVK